MYFRYTFRYSLCYILCEIHQLSSVTFCFYYLLPISYKLPCIHCEHSVSLNLINGKHPDSTNMEQFLISFRTVYIRKLCAISQFTSITQSPLLRIHLSSLFKSHRVTFSSFAFKVLMSWQEIHSRYFEISTSSAGSLLN